MFLAVMFTFTREQYMLHYHWNLLYWVSTHTTWIIFSGKFSRIAHNVSMVYFEIECWQSFNDNRRYQKLTFSTEESKAILLKLVSNIISCLLCENTEIMIQNNYLSLSFQQPQAKNNITPNSEGHFGKGKWSGSTGLL